MAKSRRKKNHSSYSQNRARRVASARPYQRYRRAVTVPSRLSLSPIPTHYFGDRRVFEPDRLVKAAFTLPRNILTHPLNAARIVARQNVRKIQPSQTKAVLAFAKPSRVALCIRRSIRKQVLHAFKQTGAGKHHRRPRLNEWSSISC